MASANRSNERLGFCEPCVSQSYRAPFGRRLSLMRQTQPSHRRCRSRNISDKVDILPQSYVGQASIPQRRELSTTAEQTDILVQTVSFQLSHARSGRLPKTEDAFPMRALMSAFIRDDEAIMQLRYLNLLVFLSSSLLVISAGRLA